jgi:DNA repair protein RadD
VISLRDYQRASVDAVLSALDEPECNPCLMLPTGTGTSVVLAELCRSLVIDRGQRVLMLTHVQELIEQNAKRLHDYFRGQLGTYAPLGVYSAGLKQKELGRSITYAGVQSIASRADELARIGVDTIIVDEAHLIPTKGEGRYRQLFSALPCARRIGLTATPWRLGHGSLTEGEGVMFSRLLTPEGTSIREMVAAGHLAPLRSKHTDAQLLELCSGVAKRGGDYVESELDAAVNQEGPNALVAREIVARGQERKHWLVFCVSVAHAREMARHLTELGYPCGVVHGAMSALERVEVLAQFRAGEIRAVANVNVLTTGYDFPAIDLLAFCRPTQSPVLYVQTAGRGMRPCEGKEDCLVLDFAGLVKTHGPITDVRPPRAKGQSSGEIPTKNCPTCSEILLISCMLCPSCGHEFEAPKQKVALHNDDIMADVRKDGVATVASWFWFQHVGQAGKKMLAVEYQFDAPVYPVDADPAEKPKTKATEYLTVWHEGDAGKWAREKLTKHAARCGVALTPATSVLLEAMNAAPHPETVKLSIKNGWLRVGRHKWRKEEQAA